MLDANTVFKSLEPTEKVPARLKLALVSEVDSIRDTMTVVEHFSGYFLSTLLATLLVESSDV